VKEVAVGVGHNLVAFLGRRVEADRKIGGVFLGKGDLIVRAVDRAGRREYEMAASTGANAFEYIDEADEIAGHIFIRTGNRPPYSGLRGQMNHGFEVAVAEKAFHACFVGQVKGKEPESRSDAELAKPCVLEPGVVIVVQVVYTHNFKSIREQAVDEMRTDETGRAGD
jgi:hypothetical protein